MDKKPLIGASFYTVIFLVLASLGNVVGYQSVQISQQNLIKEKINKRELLFQSIVDIANNKEIQRIILKSQMSRGIFPTSDISILTKKQIKKMYFIGLILSKIISKSKIRSILGKYQYSNQEMQKKISAVIEKEATFNTEIIQLKNSECNCEEGKIAQWSFPVLCSFLSPLIWFSLILYVTRINLNLIVIIDNLGDILNCFWSGMIP